MQEQAKGISIRSRNQVPALEDERFLSQYHLCRLYGIARFFGVLLEWPYDSSYDLNVNERIVPSPTFTPLEHVVTQID